MSHSKLVFAVAVWFYFLYITSVFFPRYPKTVALIIGKPHSKEVSVNPGSFSIPVINYCYQNHIKTYTVNPLQIPLKSYKIPHHLPGRFRMGRSSRSKVPEPCTNLWPARPQWDLVPVTPEAISKAWITGLV